VRHSTASLNGYHKNLYRITFRKPSGHFVSGMVLFLFSSDHHIYVMKNDKKKIKEPYEPRDTPKPPQIIEPNSGRERENPVKDDERPENKSADPGPSGNKRQHLLADEAEIDDETTI
jgi:hypothetical protein